MLNKMLNKFRGTLYGVLVGDCFGALFQESSIISKGSRLVLRNFLDGLEKETSVIGKCNYIFDHLFIKAPVKIKMKFLSL